MKDRRNLLKPEELAHRWRISAVTLANWRSEGKGPPYIKMGQVLYDLVDVEKYEAKNRITPANPKAPAVPRYYEGSDGTRSI